MQLHSSASLCLTLARLRAGLSKFSDKTAHGFDENQIGDKYTDIMILLMVIIMHYIHVIL